MAQMMRRVGIAQLAVVKSPDRIEAQALGSCVAVVFYEPFAKIGGVAHAMLPDIKYAKKSSQGNMAKFVDSAIDILLKSMLDSGAKKPFIEAKLAGGANMFPDVTIDDSMQVGRRNSESAKRCLEKTGIPIIAEDLGGTFGRTVILDTETGKLEVRTIAHGTRHI